MPSPVHRGVASVFAVVVMVLVSACASSSPSGDRSDAAEAPARTDTADCDWPMFGQGPDRLFAYPCDTSISAQTVGDLEEAWFFNTADVVTSSPAVVDGSVYVGDWSGVVYAIDAESGEPRWTVQLPTHDAVYAGQIVGSPAVTTTGGETLVFVPAGKTMYALNADDGEIAWAYELGRPGDQQEPTEIESSPVVADGLVVFGYDAHDTPGFAAGVVALEAATGEERWNFDPDLGEEPSGCVGVWGSPSVDVINRLVLAGSANCPTSPEGWGDYTEAMYALDLDTGEPQWSFQPHDPNNDDLDFAGSPNLFEIDGRPAVGLGNKDGAYYTVDRLTGEDIWQTQATGPGLENPGSNYSTGGFIGPTAVADGVIVGGTALGDCPCLHAIDADTGDILWQNSAPEPTYAAATVANGVVFLGGTDFTLRGYDLTDGRILWEQDVPGVVAGGTAVVGDDLFSVVGLREPGTDAPADSAGVYRWSLGDGDPEPTTSSTAVPANTVPVFLEPGDQPCLDQECEFPFRLPTTPEGLTPTATMLITTSPFSIRITGADFGDPIDWVRPDSATAGEGATVFGAFMSVSDENPTGSLVCVFDENLLCEGDTIPVIEPTYNRISLLALPNSSFIPTPADGLPRLMTTFAFNPNLVVIER